MSDHVTVQAPGGEVPENLPVREVLDLRGEPFTLRRVARYRLYPTKEQEAVLLEHTGLCQRLYNAAIEERRRAWEEEGKGITLKDQRDGPGSLKARAKAGDPSYRTITDGILDDVLTRVDRAFKGFFRRAKRKENPGYPRFKAVNRYRSMMIPRSREFDLEWDGSGRYARLEVGRAVARRKVLGPLRVRMHRPMPDQAAVRQLTFKREASGRWYAIFSWDIEGYRTPEHPLAGEGVGLHPALVDYLSTDRGEVREPPASLARHRRKLLARRRRFSRKNKGSGRGERARRLLARQHEKVRDSRRDFQHKLSRELVETHGLIAVNGFEVAKMIEGGLAPLRERIVNAAWPELLHMIRYKAESAGSVYVEVNARYAVQECSSCGETVPKDLSERRHSCPHCGLVLPRGVNAARNAMRRAVRALRGGDRVTGPGEPRTPYPSG